LRREGLQGHNGRRRHRAQRHGRHDPRPDRALDRRSHQAEARLSLLPTGSKSRSFPPISSLQLGGLFCRRVNRCDIAWKVVVCPARLALISKMPGCRKMPVGRVPSPSLRLKSRLSVSGHASDPARPDKRMQMCRKLPVGRVPSLSLRLQSRPCVSGCACPTVASASGFQYPTADKHGEPRTEAGKVSATQRDRKPGKSSE
jgi:hypothetical protein